MLYPSAQRHLLPAGVNHNAGGNHPRIFVIHIMVGGMQGTDQIFHDPNRQASAHFGVSKTGDVWQWVDTDDTAWHAFDANTYSIGVEHAGFADQSLTAQQVQATGKLYAWANSKYPKLSLWINKKITGSGLAYHRQYHAWNLDNHTCPGDKIIAQLPDILAVAKKG